MRVLVVHDHPVLRDGLGALVRQALGACPVVLAGGAEEALRLAGKGGPFGFVLLDLDLPGRAGPQLVSDLARLCQGSPILALSSRESAGEVRRAFGLGVRGYVSKAASDRAIAAIVRLMVEGERYVPAFVLDDVALPAWSPQPAPGARPSRLTARQAEILVRVGRGETNGEIADALRLSEKTVKAHLTAILKVMDVANRRQAANSARAAGLI